MFDGKICGKLYEDEDGQTELTQEDVVLEKTPHSYGAEWVTDETTHWHECVCGAKSGMAEHRWVQTELTAATTEEDGAAVSTCSVCKEEYEEIIPQIDGVRLSEDSYTYNGKVRIPEIYVEDIEGDEIDPAYYTIIYPTGCKNVGEYTVTVQFKGAYSGTLRETYQILPKGTTLRKLTAGSRSITVTWKKQKKQTSGYEIAYSQKKNFKGAKKVKVSGKYTSKTLTRLKTGKKYYVKIRTYRTVKINGRSKKLYSGWSKAKSVRVK